MSQLLVYGLKDPRTGGFRYVGQSTRGMARPQVHLNRVPDRYRTHCSNWLRQLQSAGLQPEIIVLQRADDRDALDAAEDYWIRLLRISGCDLTNHKQGGQSGCLDDSTKIRISQALTGHRRSPETRERMRQVKLGEKNPMFGKKHTPEANAKRAEALRGPKNHRFGLVPPSGEATRFKPGHAPWNKGNKAGGR